MVIHKRAVRDAGRSFFLLQQFPLYAQIRRACAEIASSERIDGARAIRRAVPIYQELCRALPSNPGLRLNLALAYQMSGQHQEAVPEFERVLKAEPNNQPALLSLGASYLAVE